MQTDTKTLKNQILDSSCQLGMRAVGGDFGLTGNTGHQFEGPQHSDGSEGPQVEVGAHRGEDAEEEERECAQGDQYLG